jgi:hypothetical protein
MQQQEIEQLRFMTQISTAIRAKNPELPPCSTMLGIDPPLRTAYASRRPESLNTHRSALRWEQRSTSGIISATGTLWTVCKRLKRMAGLSRHASPCIDVNSTLRHTAAGGCSLAS